MDALQLGGMGVSFAGLGIQTTGWSQGLLLFGSGMLILLMLFEWKDIFSLRKIK